ncbi:DMT family transporter [Cohaesibacter celericrescens]|uniref:EamA/RhaT family transporter n=1 Tax=Cohaesibacter celericrescens TaxID=2067669 RepID=A0A2N5XKM5_9HYPH|nr:DMT family transporter [Cohaesibacter celericrescens]PLW74987.1 EamA/RhaT family transporter [Cohaesibacter celericrescens]
MSKTTAASRDMARGDNPMLGIALMLAFCMVIPFGDALLKLLGQSVPVMTLLIARYVMQVLLLGPVMLWQKRGIAHIVRLPSQIWWRLFWRTVMHIAGISGMYFGLQHLPLADTTAIAFIFPILMLFASHFFLKEFVGPHRITAAIVGFIGTLLVVQPNFVEVGANVLWPIGTACTFVVFILVTRQMSRGIDAVSIQVVSGVMALIMLLIPVLLLNGESFAFFDLGWPSAIEWWMLIGSGVFGTVGHLLMTSAISYAPSATLAPMQYLEIPFATFIGWLVFSDFPNQLAAIGIAVTIASGLYMIYREQRAQNISGQGTD